LASLHFAKRGSGGDHTEKKREAAIPRNEKICLTEKDKKSARGQGKASRIARIQKAEIRRKKRRGPLAEFLIQHQTARVKVVGGGLFVWQRHDT